MVLIMNFIVQQWAERVFGVPVLNHWWQTESGSPITAPCLGYGVKSVPPYSAGYPVAGYDSKLVSIAFDVRRALGHLVSHQYQGNSCVPPRNPFIVVRRISEHSGNAVEGSSFLIRIQMEHGKHDLHCR